MTERDQFERTWLESEVLLAAALSDADRARVFRDLLRTADAIQRTKSAEQLSREEEVRHRLEELPARERYTDWIERST
jgi:hypothetical protein